LPAHIITVFLYPFSNIYLNIKDKGGIYMENIKRTVMLLRSTSGGNGGTLKIQSFKDGVSVYLRNENLPEGTYGLYLFLSSGREIRDFYAGEIKGREFYSTLYDVSIDNIKGAAVISIDPNGAASFVLKSTGPEWTKIIERFKISKQAAQQKHRVENTINETDPSVAYKKTEEIKVSEESKTQENTVEQTPLVIKEEGLEENGCDACPHIEKQEDLNPFPNTFPNSEWVKISYPGPAGWWHYISGKIYKGSAVSAKVLGVPGEYNMSPPVWLEGFGTYLRSSNGDAKGYWLMFQDAETGEVLDMDLSQRGG
jgi:hypothetical protein